ncbi:MAG: dTDP-4-dehydrorhamnose reductase [Planctomycetota bacterium]
MSRIAITGAKGQLGVELHRLLAVHHEVTAVDHAGCDLRSPEQIRKLFAEARPEVLINCAGFTEVDRAELDPPGAFSVNALGPMYLAEQARDAGALLIQFSTNYVFQGDKPKPYKEADPTGPINVYGASKLAGENYVRRICPRHLILRTAWLYGAGGRRSFVKTMLAKGIERPPGNEPLRVVDDQVGNPTCAVDVARVTRDLIERNREAQVTGTFHVTCRGEASWYEFASRILTQSGSDRAIEPCSSADMARPAKRPANGRLDNGLLRKMGVESPRDWRDALDQFLREHPDG